jgi:phosphoenolpyruvate carboxylase
VRKCVATLGDEIKSVYGQRTFERTEHFRGLVKAMRGLSSQKKSEPLKAAFAEFRSLKPKAMQQITHSFALMMELINRCEKAYRSHRLGEKSKQQFAEAGEIVYVFTAHPTEARSSNVIQLLDRVEDLCLQWLEEGESFGVLQQAELRQTIALLLRVNLSKTKSPTVKDEASWLYDIILNPEVIDELIELNLNNTSVRFRSWVGGDKDGHPYVDHRSTAMSWKQSRRRIVDYALGEFDKLDRLLSLTGHQDFEKLRTLLAEQRALASELLTIAEGDARRVKAFRKSLDKLRQTHQKAAGEESPQLKKVEYLFELFPALVVSLEFREDSEVVTAALKDKDMSINKMFQTLARVSKGGVAKNYVQGFVLSMVQTSEDVSAGIRLMKKHLKKNMIPVIPLFETRSALKNAVKIVKEVAASEPEYMQSVKSNWSGKFEVMLGYSDSSKENGVLLSRILISETLVQLSDEIHSLGLTPVFFHGSGGSVERGGGSISEQISGWPPNSLHTFKSTIQGEMISRNFGNPIIMNRLIEKWQRESDRHQKSWRLADYSSLSELAENVSVQYRELVASDWFRNVVLNATPYSFLDQLKIGSRPSKRNKNQNEFKMRAIPWVLCWTQTRSLIPVWWGLGTYWSSASEAGRDRLLADIADSDLLKSYFKVLGFSLEKVDLSILNLYLSENLDDETASESFQKIATEHAGAVSLYQFVVERFPDLAPQAWLIASIKVRSPNIDLLNFAQILAVKNQDMELLREATTGIASGMLTTG